MPWRLGILAALLGWLFLAGPAAADIQRYTDSRGVIHIGNVPSKPAPSLPDSPTEAPEAMPGLPEPAAAMAPVVSEPKIDTPSSTETDLDSIQKVCQTLVQGQETHKFEEIAAAAALAAAETETKEEVDYNYLPLKKVSHDQGVLPLPAPQQATAKTAGELTSSGIRRYRDAQGVWHITNMAPVEENTAPAMQVAEKRHDPRNVSSERPQERQTESGLPWRPAAWSPEASKLASLPTTPGPARSVTTGAPGAIRRYRDSKGVIHIENVEPEPREALPPASSMARNGPAPLIEGAWVLQPVAWDGEGGIQPLRRGKAAAAKKSQIQLTMEGGIQRYRDQKGVWHIKTVEYPLPPGVVLAHRFGGPKSSTTVAAAAPPSHPPRPPTSPASLPGHQAGTMQTNPVTSSSAVASITAFKDAKGRLRITTQLPSPDPGKMPPPTVASVELEPLIQEAAQVHRLPATLIRAVIKVESDFCSWAVSPKGAMGLMQLMPGTANLLGVREPFNPRENILGGCRYLRSLIDLFGGNLSLALASYNAGFQRVIDCGYQIPPIKETQDFVTQVMGRYVADEKRARLPFT